MHLNIWRLHPDGARIVPAEKTLNNQANPSANKWCGPYNNANKAGFWLYPPTNIDIMWKGKNTFEYRHHEKYSDADYHLVRELVRESDHVDPDQWCLPGGRTKYTWGAADDGVVQIWSGSIMQTDPGWGLLVRSPSNVENKAYRVQDAILETDWMFYDIWFNVKIIRPHKWVYLRKNQWPPLAQLIPVPRQSYDPAWSMSETMVNRDTPEGEKVFKYWLDYNHKKFGMGGNQRLSAECPELRKDSTTYMRERREHVSRCPFSISVLPRDPAVGDQLTPLGEVDSPPEMNTPTKDCG